MAMPSLEIHADGLSKSFKAVKALEHVDVAFHSGAMHGVIGPEGAGKTTLMRLLLKLLTPSEGRIHYKQGDNEVDFETIRPHVAYMPQQQSLYADLSVDEHLDFFRVLYGISAHDYREKRESLLQITRLGPFADRPAGKLSGGMYKKLGLMCALLRSPQIILLDEPTNGVDPISRREFWELLYQLADQNILIVLTTAYLDEAERCGFVHLLEQGRVVAKGEPRQLLSESGAKTFDELFLQRAAHAKE